MKNIANPFLIVAALLAALMHPSAQADCAGGSLIDVKKSYASAKSFDAQGKQLEAFNAYLGAQEYICETNPYEVEAATRAAALALKLAPAEAQRGNLDDAFRIYEHGGHYAKADEVLMMLIRAAPDSPPAFEKARSHFENRATPAFKANDAVRLKITGAYQVNVKHVADVQAMPAAGVARALKREAVEFNDAYLRETVQVIQNRTDSVTDMAATQRSMSTFAAYKQKWPDDLLKQSRATLGTLRQWGSVTQEAALRNTVEQEYARRLEHHIDALMKLYGGAPDLLENAIDYVHMLQLDAGVSKARVLKIRALALKLGDEAQAKRRFILAADYFDVAGDDAKRQAARDQLNKSAMAQVQPALDAMQKQAAQIQAQYSDPAKVQALREQAEAMHKSFEQTRAQQKDSRSAAALEAELGL